MSEKVVIGLDSIKNNKFLQRSGDFLVKVVDVFAVEVGKFSVTLLCIGDAKGEMGSKIKFVLNTSGVGMDFGLSVDFLFAVGVIKGNEKDDVEFDAEELVGKECYITTEKRFDRSSGRYVVDILDFYEVRS